MLIFWLYLDVVIVWIGSFPQLQMEEDNNKI